MTLITSRRNPTKFYGALAIGLIVCFALGTLVLWASIGIICDGQAEAKNFAMPLFSLAFYGLGILMVWRYYQNVPIIIVDQDSIAFKKEIFFYKDIKNVILTGKVPFRFLHNIPHEGTTLIFEDGTQKVFFDDFYANSSELKTFLDQTVVKKQEYIPKLPNIIDRCLAELGKKDVFKGNQFTSFRGILLWGMFAFSTCMLIANNSFGNRKVLVPLLIFGTFWFLFNSWLMNYFEISERFLIVKNHNFIGKSKVYELSTIKEVVFEMIGRSPNSMRIITTDFQNKIFPAATLRDHTWLEMKTKLESKGIKVRNECI